MKPPVIRTVMTTAVTTAVLAAVLTGCRLSTTATPSGSPGTAGTATTGTSAPRGSAAAALNRLPVKAAASMSGYARVKDFGPAWTDSTDDPGGRNHCDTRDDILRRDLTGVRLESGSRCTVASGVLDDPYTGRTIHFTRGRSTSTAVQIDHLVPLGDAWTTGAAALPAAEREELANDPLNLLAADGPANEGKGDSDASGWLPGTRAFRCEYVSRQIAVKVRYHLWVTPAEKAAMARVLASCPGEPLPVEGSHEVELKP